MSRFYSPVEKILRGNSVFITPLKNICVFIESVKSLYQGKEFGA